MVSGLDEAEYRRLEDAVSSVEKLIGTNGEGIGSTSILVDFVRNAKMRLETLENDGLVQSTDKERKESEKWQSAAIMHLVQRETQLTDSERGMFGGFLSKDYFTKSDFNQLDEFYGSAWDRLSEKGKSEMSNRVWEGIRQGEYEFTDLPKNVKEKESERIYNFFMNPETMPESFKNIPDKDRDDFIHKYESGNRDAAYEVLNRDSYKESVALNSDVANKASANNVEADKKENEQGSDQSRENKTDDNLDKYGLDDLSLSDANHSTPPSVSIKNETETQIG